MRYYVTIGKGEEAYRRTIHFEETADGLVAHLSGVEDDGVESHSVRIDFASLEQGRSLNLILGDTSHDFHLDPLPEGYEIHYRGDHLRVAVIDERELLARSIHGTRGSGAREVRASMPGIVVGVEIEEQQEIHDGQTLVVLEAMKMLNPITADGSGRVVKIHVRTGQAVAAGELLLTLG